MPVPAPQRSAPAELFVGAAPTLLVPAHPLLPTGAGLVVRFQAGATLAVLVVAQEAGLDRPKALDVSACQIHSNMLTLDTQLRRTYIIYHFIRNIFCT